MGITLNQLDQFAGGAVEGYTGSQANRRFNARNTREQAEEDRTATDYENLQKANALEAERVRRIAEIEAYQQTNTTSMQQRARIDEKWAATGQQGAPGPAMPGAPYIGGAATPGRPNIPPPTPPQFAGGIGALPELPVQGAADGGPVEVDPGAQGLPVQQQPPQQQPVQSLPVEQAPEQPAYKTRRQEYQAWYQKASAAHAKAGGLKGLQAFRDQENALSRKQMLGYGTKGVAAMRDGNAGDAVRQLNTMLDVSPEDSGMRWEAFDGNVYLVGSDGNKGKPYDQAAVMSLIENKIKTPENYLAFQQEAREQGIADETARKNLENEKVAKQKADTGTSTAETYAGQLALDKKYRPRETSAEEARALAALITAKSSRDRAAAALAVDSNWTAAQIIKLYADADTWAFEDAMIPKEHQKAFNDDTTAWSTYKADVMNQMTHNPAQGGPTREEASQVSMFLRQPGGLNMNDEMSLRAKQDATGAIIVDYMGKQWRLPYSLGVAALNLGIIEDAVEPPEDATTDMGGGDKEQKDEPALPDEPRKYGARGAIPAAYGAITKALTR